MHSIVVLSKVFDGGFWEKVKVSKCCVVGMSRSWVPGWIGELLSDYVLLRNEEVITTFSDLRNESLLWIIDYLSAV